MRKSTTNKITAILTTIPARENILSEVIGSIYNQVGSIRIIFNGYSKVPDWVESKPKVKAWVDASNKDTDCAKWKVAPEEGYVFSIDDDILYPKDYVSTLIEKIEQYSRECVVTVHGSYFKIPFLDFRKSKRCIHFTAESMKDVEVDLPGSATLAYHVDTIKPRFEDFFAPSRSDIWFSALCHKKKIPIICIARKKNWLKLIPTKGLSIWRRTRIDKDFLQKNTEYVAKYIIPYKELDKC